MTYIYWLLDVLANTYAKVFISRFYGHYYVYIRFRI